MIRRILPLGMALTIALCPVALDVCQVACAQHEHDAALTSVAGHQHVEPDDAMVAHRHGHHGTPAAALATASDAGTAPRIPADTVRGVPHACIHGDELPTFVRTTLQIALAPAGAVPTLFELPDPASDARIFVDTDSVVHSPPLTLTTQLRV